MKTISRIIALFLVLLSLGQGSMCTVVTAAEVDKGLVIIDNAPWKVSWVQESEKTWVLKALFENGTLSTYFNTPPRKTGLDISRDNKPYKQVFSFHSGEKFESAECQYEEWLDGAKAYSFLFNKMFKMNGANFLFATTAIIEEVESNNDEIRYAYFRDLTPE